MHFYSVGCNCQPTSSPKRMACGISPTCCRTACWIWVSFVHTKGKINDMWFRTSLYNLPMKNTNKYFSMLLYIETQWNSDLLGPQMHLLKSQMIVSAFKLLYNIFLSFLVWKFKYRKYPCLRIPKFFLSSDFKNLKILNGKCYQIYIHSLSNVLFIMTEVSKIVL